MTKPKKKDAHRHPLMGVRIPPELVKAAKKRAIDEGKSLRAFIEEALEEHLKMLDK